MKVEVIKYPSKKNGYLVLHGNRKFSLYSSKSAAMVVKSRMEAELKKKLEKGER